MTSPLGSLGTIVKGWVHPKKPDKTKTSDSEKTTSTPLEMLRIHTQAPDTDPQSLSEKEINKLMKQFKEKVTSVVNRCTSSDGHFKTKYFRREVEDLEKHIHDLYKLDETAQNYFNEKRKWELQQSIHDADKLYLHFKDVAKAYGQTPIKENTILIQNPNPECITLKERAKIVNDPTEEEFKKNAARAISVSRAATQRAEQRQQLPLERYQYPCIIPDTPLQKYQTLIKKLENFYNKKECFKTLTPKEIATLKPCVEDLAPFCENVIRSNPEIVDDSYFKTLNLIAIKLCEAFIANTSQPLTNAVAEPPTAEYGGGSARVDKKIEIFKFKDARIPVQPFTRIIYEKPRAHAFIVNYLRENHQMDIEGVDEFWIEIPNSCFSKDFESVKKLYRRYKRQLKKDRFIQSRVD